MPGRKKRSRGFLFSVALSIIVVAVVIVAAQAMGAGIFSVIADTVAPPSGTAMNGDTVCALYMIDVGQGESLFIQTRTMNVLIDAGENNQGTTVENFLLKKSVKRIDILINTHPDSDHIGGMDYIIRRFDIGKVIMPYVTGAILPTTPTYLEVLRAIDKKGLTIDRPHVGDSFPLGDGVILSVMACKENADNINDYSIVTRLAYQGFAAMLMGDASGTVEQSITGDIRSDVLAAGHHGSRYSSSAEFLAKALPKYVLISVGANNDYGHPQKEALARFAAIGATVYRTDLNSNISVLVDSAGNYSVTTDKP